MTYWSNNKVIFNNNPLLPSNLKMLIIGASNCGKTSRLFDMLINDYFDFNRFIICSKSMFQPDYEVLIAAYKYGLTNNHIKKLFANAKEIYNYKQAIELISKKIPKEKKSNIEVITYENPNLIPNPEDLKDIKKKTLFILDDVLIGAQEKIENLFVYGRHSWINIVYLSQSYFRLKRQTIRNNSNMFIFFKLNKLDIENIWRDQCSIDFKVYSDFEKLIEQVFGY